MKNEIKEAAVVTKDTVSAENAVANWKHITDKGGICTHEYDILTIGEEQIVMHYTANSEVTSVNFSSLEKSNKMTCSVRIFAWTYAKQLGGRPANGEWFNSDATEYTFGNYESAKKFVDGLLEMIKSNGIIAIATAEVQEVAEVDVTEYAVSPDAQEVAVQAEIENAVAKFEVGKKYRQAQTNEEYAYTITVEKRTRNYLTVTVENNYGITVKESRRLRIFEGSTMEIVEYNGRQRLHIVFHSLDVVKESNTPIMEIAQDDAAENANIAQEEIAAMIESEMDSAVEDEALATVGEVWDYEEIGTPEMTLEEKEVIVKIAEETVRETAEERKANVEKALMAEIEKIKGMDAEKVPLTFEVERFGEDNAIAQKFSAVVDSLIEEFSAKVKGAGFNQEMKFDVQLFNDANAAVKEGATPAKFEVGKIYYGKISSGRVYAEVKVIKRTAKFVTVVDYSESYEYIDYDEAERHRIQIDNKGELIELNDDFGVPYYVRANHSEPPKKYKDKNGQAGYYFEDDACIPEEVTATLAVEEVPVVDEEKALIEECGALEKKIEEMKEKLSTLEKARFNVVGKLRAIYNKRYESARKDVQEIVRKAGAKGAMIEIHAQDNEYYWFADSRYWNAIYCSIDHRGRLGINFEDREIASYSDIGTFKAAVREFAAAIERGDEVYTFPADDANNTANA